MLAPCIRVFALSHMPFMRIAARAFSVPPGEDILALINQERAARIAAEARAAFLALLPCRGARLLTRGYLQTIQGSSGKPSKEAVVCRRFRRARNRAHGP